MDRQRPKLKHGFHCPCGDIRKRQDDRKERWQLGHIFRDLLVAEVCKRLAAALSGVATGHPQPLSIEPDSRRAAELMPVMDARFRREMATPSCALSPSGLRDHYGDSACGDGQESINFTVHGKRLVPGISVTSITPVAISLIWRRRWCDR
jgi:hypothetical protein